MSADAGDAGTGAATAQPAAGTGAAGTSDDEGGAQLLDNMLAQGGGEEGASSVEDLKAEVQRWKEMSRKHEGRAKANSAAAAKLQQLEQANMSELEKAQAAQRQAETERDEARSLHARMMAAAANNLPVELVEHLGTGTEDEINERAALFAQVIEDTAVAIAEQLLSDRIANGELIAGNGTNRNGVVQQTTAARPVESMRAGSAPAGTAPQTTEQWFRQLLHGS